MDRTLTKRTVSAKESLEEVFGCGFCYSDVNALLSGKRTLSAFDKDDLNIWLESLDLPYDNLETPEDYRKAFSDIVISEDNPNGRIYRNSKEWRKALWKKFDELCTSYSHPVDFMQRMVDNLGDEAFASDPLRLRILKQLLKNIDFSGTKTDIGKLKKYNTADPAKLAELSDTVFEKRASFRLYANEDINAMLKIFSPYIELSEDDPGYAQLTEYLKDDIKTGLKSDEAPLLVYLNTLIQNGYEVFDKEKYDIEDIRIALKNILKRYIEKYDFAYKEVITAFPRISSPKNCFKAHRYIMEHSEEFGKFNSMFSVIPESKLNSDVDEYRKAKEAGFDGVCAGDDSELYKECYDRYTEWYKNCYNIRKSLVTPKRQYHNQKGEWTADERFCCELVKYCDYLATGGNTELDPVFAKTALYLFAFGFGLRYYPDKETEYDPLRDIKKNLFIDFYNDNLIQFLEDKVNRYEREPNGLGINPKNYVECVYLHYLGRDDIPIRKRLRAAQNLIAKIDAAGEVNNDIDPTDMPATKLYGETHLPELLAIRDEASLFDYIIKNFVVVRKNNSTSPLKIAEGSQSACREYEKLLKKIRDIYETSSDSFIASAVKDTCNAAEPYRENSILLGAVLDRINNHELSLTEFNPKNVTRTKLLTLYFIWFRTKFANTGNTLGDAYRYFAEFADKYLEAAGFQPVSPKNIFDMALVLLAYGFMNFIE